MRLLKIPPFVHSMEPLVMDLNFHLVGGHILKKFAMHYKYGVNRIASMLNQI
jgi:hypothetical protein